MGGRRRRSSTDVWRPDYSDSQARIGNGNCRVTIYRVLHSISIKPRRNEPNTICVPSASVVTDGMVIRMISLGTIAPNEESPHLTNAYTAPATPAPIKHAPKAIAP